MALSSSDLKKPFFVQAVYAFKGKHNDELCFKKGDIITVTQVDNGGWWEGTLDEKTGWFPSNYVKEYKISGNSNGSDNVKQSVDPSNQQELNRTFILKDLINSEKANVAELQMLVNKFLHPVPFLKIMSREEYNQLTSNISQVVDIHERLLSNLEEIAALPPSKQKIGGMFLSMAPKIKQIYQIYCSAHPKAVLIIEKYREELGRLMEANGTARPGILILTAGLSKPFRKLDKYAGILQELERYIEEYNADRGDIQRSISVFKDIVAECLSIRYQKDIELVLLSGCIHGFKGNLNVFGEIIHMGSVAICPDYKDLYFLLFASSLVIVSVSRGLNSFQYEGAIPLIGVNVTKLEDSSDMHKNSFEISGPLMHQKIVVICQTKQDQQEWINKLQYQIKVVRRDNSNNKQRSSLESSTCPPRPIVTTRNSCTAAAATSVVITAANNNNSSNNSSYYDSSFTLPRTAAAAAANLRTAAAANLRTAPVTTSQHYCIIPPATSAAAVNDVKFSRQNGCPSWSVTNLHILAPIHSTTRYSLHNTDKFRDQMDDVKILQVIESYCTNVKSHYVINPSE